MTDIDYQKLLEGLEVSILDFSQVNQDNEALFRLEAEYFKKEYLRIEKKLVGSPTINSINAKITCGPFGSNLLDSLYQDKGVLVVRPFNLKLSKVEDDNLVFINESDLAANNLKIFREGTLLFSRVGDIKIGVVNKRDVTISPNIIATEFSNDVIAKYLCVFFQTYYGFKQIERQLKISAQPTISTEIIGKLKFPVTTLDFQTRISNLLEYSFEIDRKSKTIYNKADVLLLESVGLKNFSPSEKSFSIKLLGESFLDSGRLDAEYYQPKYDDLETHLLQTGSAIKLGTHLLLNKRGTQPFYTESKNGIPVLNSKHIRENMIDFSDNRLGVLEEYSDLVIRENDVLINGTGVGTIGRSAVYMQKTVALPDNHVTILRTKDLDPVFLSVQLNSIIGKLQVEKYFKGSSGQIELYPADINEFIIWKAKPEIQKKIREAIEESEDLRLKAKAFLEIAKEAVEIAIEVGERKAIAHINQNTK